MREREIFPRSRRISFRARVEIVKKYKGFFLEIRVTSLEKVCEGRIFKKIKIKKRMDFFRDIFRSKEREYSRFMFYAIDQLAGLERESCRLGDKARWTDTSIRG